MDRDELEGLIAERIDMHEPGVAVAVVKGGEVVYERCRGLASLEWHQPIAPDTVMALASLTKPFTAQCVLLLEDANKLHLSDSVASYLPDLSWLDPRISIAHLLTHTSGIANYVTQPGFWENSARRDHTPAELAALIGTFTRDFAPGDNYSYSNSGYALLGMLIEAVTGMPYDEYVRAAIFEPLGMTDSRYLWDETIIPRYAGGYERAERHYQRAPRFSATLAFANGGLGATLHDLIRWDAALREGRLLPEGVDARMCTPLMLNDGRRLGYGLGWGLSRYRGHSVAHHAGGVPGFSSFYGRFLDDDLSIIILSNLGGFDASGLAADIANHALSLTSPTLTPVEVTSEELNAAEGGYRNFIGEQLDVARVGEHLEVRENLAGALVPLGDATFALATAPDESVRFEALGPAGYLRATAIKPFYWFVVERTPHEPSRG